MTSIGIIVGSTRPGRKGEAVATWVHKLASQRDDASYDILDIAAFDLPHLDEPEPAAKSADYQNEHTRRWSDAVAERDGFVFITPEYNHSISGSLKNAIDYLYHEWRDKSAGFVGYGLMGATRAVEQLRLIMGELHVADVRDQIALSLFNDFDGDELTPADHHVPMLHRMLDEVVAWADALAPLRDKD